VTLPTAKVRKEKNRGYGGIRTKRKKGEKKG
jgi:hypothetical protein